MNKQLFLWLSACLFVAVLLQSCSIGHKAVAHAGSGGSAREANNPLAGKAPHKALVVLSNDIKKHPATAGNKDTTAQVRKAAAIAALPAARPAMAARRNNSAAYPPLMPAPVPEINPAPVTDAAADDAAVNNTEPAPNMDVVVSKYAGMISIEPAEIKNYPLFRFIDNWYGTEYKWGGTDNNGIDCSGFSQKLYDEVYGVELLRTAREQHSECERFRHTDDAEQGDLVFFRAHHFRISHVGVYLANGFFVHASSSQGVVISNLHNKYWRRRFAGCGRMPKDNAASESEYIP